MGNVLRMLGLSVSLAAVAAPAFGQTAADCARLQSSLMRLDCYDGLFGRTAPVPEGGKSDRVSGSGASGDNPAEAPEGGESDRDSGERPTSGKGDLGGGTVTPNRDGKTAKRPRQAEETVHPSGWRLEEIGTEKRLVTLSERMHRNIIGYRAQLSLTISCRDNVTSMSIAFGGNVVASPFNTVRVAFSIDRHPPIGYQLRIAPDYKEVGLWGGGEAIPVVRSWFGAETVTVEGLPFFSSPTPATFSVVGLATEMTPVRRACNW